MSEQNTKSDNRRDYYRVGDFGVVDYQLTEDDQIDPESIYCQPIYSEMLNELQNIDSESSKLLSQVTENDRTLGAVIKAINKKLDTIARTVALTNIEVNEESLIEINLSEGGMAFSTRQPELIDQFIALRVVLVPSYLTLITKAKIVNSEAQGGHYWTRVSFLDLNDGQRQLIARHILKVQQQKRRTSE